MSSDNPIPTESLSSLVDGCCMYVPFFSFSFLFLFRALRTPTMFSNGTRICHHVSLSSEKTERGKYKNDRRPDYQNGINVHTTYI